MRHGDLFAGIGAFSLAARWMKWKTEFWVENNPFCQKVLRKNFPGTKEYADIRETDFTVHKGLDILTAGFPCQPFSHAGKRKGDQDDRFLWPEVPRAAIESQARFILGENVTGLLTMENGKTLERILSDLEIAGYEVETFIVPAAAVGAWHRRDRVWIFAHNTVMDGTPILNLRKSTIAGMKKGWKKDMSLIQYIFHVMIPTIGANEMKGSSRKRYCDSEEFRGAKTSEYMRLLETDPIYLHPSFAEAMMGFPMGWTELNHSETQ